MDKKKDELKIEWFGIDGLLVILYPIIAVVWGYAIINDVDFIVGRVIPYGVSIVVTAIFIKYISQVISFSKSAKK